MSSSPDWREWHAQYDVPDSPLARRLRIVQGRISQWLDEHPDRALRVVSVWAGEGRDILEVLAGRPDADRVSAVLIERDERNAASARRAVDEAGLRGSAEIRCADAGHPDSHRGATPADLLLFCGVFGNIPDGLVRRSVDAMPRLMKPGGTVIWTRSRREPDLTPAIRAWFAESGFVEHHFDAPPDALFSVGVHQLAAPGYFRNG